MVKSFPVRDQNELAVTWPVTPSIRQYKKGGSPYVQHFLESEAEGSLIALLDTTFDQGVGAVGPDRSLVHPLVLQRRGNGVRAVGPDGSLVHPQVLQ
jgi:hypothetical protein